MIACSKNNDTAFRGNPTCGPDSSVMQHYPKKISSCLSLSLLLTQKKEDCRFLVEVQFTLTKFYYE